MIFSYHVFMCRYPSLNILELNDKLFLRRDVDITSKRPFTTKITNLMPVQVFDMAATIA
jgi:hypothetical protein